MAAGSKATIVTYRGIFGRIVAQDRDCAAECSAAPTRDEKIAVAAGRGPGEYGVDSAEVARYASMARTPEGFAVYMDGFAPACVRP